MTDTSLTASRVTADTLAAFSDAFNRHDADALMGWMTEDCVFDAAGGPEVYGTRFVGRDAVRAAFEAVFRNFPDAHWGHGRHYVIGDRGVSEWVFTGTHVEGWRRLRVNGRAISKWPRALANGDVIEVDDRKLEFILDPAP